jgi:hypothetical protein
MASREPWTRLLVVIATPAVLSAPLAADDLIPTPTLSGARSAAGLLRSSPGPGNDERAKDVHVRSQSGRAVAPPEPIHARHVVVDRVDAQPPELRRHGGSARPASPQRLDALDRETPLAVVPLGTGREVAGVLLRKGGEAAPGVGQRREFEVHRQRPRCPSNAAAKRPEGERREPGVRCCVKFDAP